MQKYLINQGKSENTVKAYLQDLQSYFNFIESKKLSRENILKYRNYLLRQNKDARTVNRHLSALKQYNQYLINKKTLDNLLIIPKDYINIQNVQMNPNGLNEKEVNEFIRPIKENEPYRNYAIVVLLANTGLRISEALNLKLDNLFLDDNEATIIGKGNKQREIILYPNAVKVLREYLANHRAKYKYAKDSEYVFVSNKGNKLSYRSVDAIFKKYGGKITPHKLRHYFGAMLYRETKDLRLVQDQLGHSSPNVTVMYTYLSKEDKKKSLGLISVG